MLGIIIPLIIITFIILYLKLAVYLNHASPYKYYSQLKKEWILLANEFNLDTNIEDGNSYIKWIKGFQPYIRGNINGYFIEITIEKPNELSPLYINCEIDLKHNDSFYFSLASSQIEPQTKDIKKIDTGREYFDLKFCLFSNNDYRVKEIFSYNSLNQVISLFTVNMQGAITLRQIETTDNPNEIILDSINKKVILYREPSTFIKNPRERKSMIRKINFLIDLAAKIDNFTKN